MAVSQGPSTRGTESPEGVADALAYLTCVLVARRTRATPERVTWQQYDVLEMLRLQGPMTPSV